MPNIKSAKKRVLVSAKKTSENKSFKSAYKTLMKKYEAAIAEGNKENAAVLYPEVVKATDKAAAKGVLHTNNAARKKSRFTLMLKKLG